MDIFKSAFLQLPDELKIHIIDQLSDRTDLFNLCLTCRNLDSITSATLYRDINVKIPPDNTFAWNLGGIPLLRDDVVSSVKRLDIRNDHANISYPAYDRSQRHYGSIELLIQELLQKMPERHLQKLSFLHQSPVTENILVPLFEKQTDSLEELDIYHLKCHALSPESLPSKLKKFECRTFTDGKQIGRLLYSSRRSLRTLRLGQEKLFVERYTQSDNAYAGQNAEPLEQLTSTLAFPELTCLQELELYGINLLPLPSSTNIDTVFYSRLQKLTLESCYGSSELLDLLARVYAVTGEATKDTTKPRLRDFRLRHENPDSDFRSSLDAFLGSFEGLESLSLLFENATSLQKPSAIIKGHGKTLKKVVLECRIEPRRFIAHDTSRPFGSGDYSQALWVESVREICNACPNIEELGAGFPWNDELIKLGQALPKLHGLRTIHIRNFPESNSVVQLGDYSIRQFAQKFLDRTFPTATALNPPALEMLAIGPTLYQSRWKVDFNRGPLPEYLKTHYFCVDWHTNPFGHWLPLLTSVNEKAKEKLRDQRPTGGVFESIWLK